MPSRCLRARCAAWPSSSWFRFYLFENLAPKLWSGPPDCRTTHQTRVTSECLGTWLSLNWVSNLFGDNVPAQAFGNNSQDGLKRTGKQNGSTRTSTHTYTHKHTHIHTHTRIHKYTYIHIHAQTHIHKTHTHTHTIRTAMTRKSDLTLACLLR